MNVLESLISGRWESAAPGGDVLERSSPFAPGAVEFVIPDVSTDQLDKTIATAHHAQAEWCAMSVVEQADALRSAAAAMRANVEPLASVLVAEVGKTKSEAIGEIQNAARVFEFHSGSVMRERGVVVKSARAHTHVMVEWEPVGVVGAITPWNFPVNLTAVKMAPALAAGNAFVIKPSSEAAATTTALIRLVAPLFPSGLLSIVNGGGTVGRAVVDHSGIDAITFTGSTAVGRQVAATAAARGVPFQCEMGGRNSIVIMESADLDVAVPAAVASAYRMAGQKCTAASSLVVDESIVEDVIERITAELATDSMVLGDPREASTVIGPLISTTAVDHVTKAVEEAVAAGATLCWPPDGKLTVDELEGSFIRPVLITGTTPDMDIAREEVFGPVLTIVPVASVVEASEAVNAAGYGLVSSIFTKDLAEAMTFSGLAKAGTVLVNQPTTGLDFHIQFGGWGLSGQGPTEQSDSALRAYMRPKTRYLSWTDPTTLTGGK
ncbi:aldehyde dehydrogenase (NAD+) [Arthrobacter pigmenti]|uniref:Aldehyde dehydrogenase (NAD+) n=1 Tax=Arthrobacter pigmenti TaxID=271432 RepID=A0A846RXB9_9MICC|nr:aldehyde dehydrogenase family protein [Arthrobacter pigmenti]NJC23646.1 aldehyde dehydrogenase (NAD+) [Arthrobacter pigmenti]